MAALFKAGKSGVAKVGGITLAMEEWSATIKGNIVETTNFESSGYYQGVLGIQSADWTLNGQWDFNGNDFTDPPGLYPRDDGVNMILQEFSPGQASNVTFPSWICSSSAIHTSAKGNITFNSSGTSNGTFTYA